MTSWKDWKKADEAYAQDFPQRMQEMTPEPLFESFYLPAPKVCLRCAQQPATSLLYSPFGMQPVLPLCSICAADWNFSGYHILKGMRAQTLLWRLGKFKARHPFSSPSILEIYRDVRNMLRWVRKMNRLKKSRKDAAD